MKQTYLMLVLQAPLAAYGNEAVDRKRPTSLMPGKSMLTGLLGNALGYRRQDVLELDKLQSRLQYGARIEILNPYGPLRDFHTAQLGSRDLAWTTYGVPEGRSGSSQTYQSPEIREVDYLTEHRTLVALALNEPGQTPTLDHLAEALNWPKRPLFIGRKCCLPERPIFEKTIEAENSTEALHLAGTPNGTAEVQMQVQWDEAEQHVSVSKTRDVWVSDLKDWSNNIHTGRRMVNQGIQRLENQPEEIQRT